MKRTPWLLLGCLFGLLAGNAVSNPYWVIWGPIVGVFCGAAIDILLGLISKPTRQINRDKTKGESAA